MTKKEDNMNRKHIYVAGPYTKDDPVINTRLAILAGTEIYRMGAFPVIPHLTLLVHMIEPQELEFWYEYDMNQLARCDAAVRLPGPSTGADEEMRVANEVLQIPIFHLGNEPFTVVSLHDMITCGLESWLKDQEAIGYTLP